MEAIPSSEVSIAQTVSMRAAMSLLEASARQFVVVVDDEQRLVGVVTDGDLRRALLSGYTLLDSVQLAMNRDFHVALEGYEATLVESLMLSRGIRQLPVVDQGGRPIEVLLAPGLRTTPGRRNRIVIMAGGRGSRLRPLTDEVPKPMLTVAGVPILELILRNYSSQGFRNFTLVVGYLSDVIRDYFLDGAALGVNISYFEEDEPRGTVGSLARIEFGDNLPVIVSNADVISSVDLVSLINAHVEGGFALTIAARQERIPVPFGVLETASDRVLAWNEKPNLTLRVSAGVYVVDSAAFGRLKGETADMPDLVNELLASGQRVGAHDFDGLWIDVGTHDTLRAVSEMGGILLGGGRRP